MLHGTLANVPIADIDQLQFAQLRLKYNYSSSMQLQSHHIFERGSITIRKEMHRHEDNANWQDFTVPVSLSMLGDCANITESPKKEHKYVLKIFKKSHFKIC